MNIRKLLLGLVLFGIIGLLVELLLLEHIGSWTQWLPLVSLGAGLASTLMVLIRPGRASFIVFRAVMTVFVIAGVLGLYLHLAGNMEWALERDPDVKGIALFWEALKGATPTLAPGALTQLGLLGLVYSYRHPSIVRFTDVNNNSGETL